MIFASSQKQCLAEFLQSTIRASDSVGVTIGNFDGMHRGHQELFARVFRHHGKARKPVSVFVTFEPHPRVTLERIKLRSAAPLRAYKSITPLRRKVELAAEFGFDVCYVIRFNKSFSQTSAEAFVKDYIVDSFSPAMVVVGYDWSFGRGREGSPDTLRTHGERYGFGVDVVEPVSVDGMRVSSSELRHAIAKADLPLCAKLLGRDFDISGSVVKGASLGASIGFPTANMRPGRTLLPPNGVYVSKCHVDGRDLESITNIGRRPTVDGGELLLETHILVGSDHDLYHKRIRVSLLSFLRSECDFGGLEELKRQIAHDVQAARKFHNLS